ncbi:lipoma-preferred partner isoform X1 [Fukomys damarensis]|uniref:lipoma-preferred partner isoform X1 n=1 Tax=Fukomys damarensis TaxID=885580 RepID=UPI00053F90F3|nr:lipoma-preferred partner isoform X1 [Fukomys damarensis]XP_010622426.1 lipoma-preferred partner isoform X1 [Fukomys damarensis]XP_010622427.1 lipoma-preferred partner isoform X1 [Fukomys damarensis]XP_010622428.1 lipoma-preferred partner isoform X1 [Fukomys damarensis]XP_010622429.1 lipoma-preferred partner isoform X1 [Fukomys damarensis]XP_010622430.1 lipoma-preferred partner isoform X1 [Fukomys damarensis]XP_010622431.1 lipoma-preferred partner isoform X1 [Fukomys damarensis]XP_01062243
MSYPTWLPPKSTGEPLGHVPARMETTHSFGTPSISVSTQQPPKKFAPVVAPKPKYNPYKQPGAEGDFLPPPPPPLEDPSTLLPGSGNFPPPPPLDEGVSKVQGNPGGKTLEERRSSLDAEIDSLTSILADLESTSPYKPRAPQGCAGSTTSPPVATPVTGHKRMVIPNQPPLTATKKSTVKPQAAPQAGPIPVAPIGTLKPQPQPVPASYTTAPTPSRPTFNVQVKSAQPSPHYTAGPSSGQIYGPGPHGYNTQPVPVSGQCPPPPTRGGTDYTYVPPQGLQPEPAYGYAPNQGRYYDPYYAAGPGYGGRNDSDPAYSQQGHPNTWKREPGYTPPVAGNQNPTGMYPAAGPKKTYITDPVAAPCAPPLQPKGGHTGPMGPPSLPPPSFRPEDELEHLTKKMLYDMENPPADEYFGRCARCGENVVGEGTGCTAMDQVFHVDCFTCIICNNKLRGQPFYAVEKKAYCEPCYINTLEQCKVCSKPIMERILRATGKAYHPHCFTCVMCHRSLDGIPFTVDAGGLIHCIEDFHKKFAPRCSVCKEPIMPAPGQEETVRIVALDRDFHVHCYRCEDCGGLLSEGDNQGCYPLDGHILCKTCNSARIRVLTAKASTDL